MNKKLILLPIIAALTACGTTDPYIKRADAERERKEKYVDKVIDKAPDWITKLPLSNSAVYESGTASSSDLSMADLKAKADAYGKICMAAGGTASQRTKIYKTDSDAASTEFTEMALRTSCKEVNLTGIEIREIKRISEGTRFRTYVLVALPTGDANLLRKAQDAQKQREFAQKNMDKAFQELDKMTLEQPQDTITPKE
jgi:hypothetical protein